MILTERRSPHQPGESDSPSPSPLWGWQRQLKVVVRQNKYLMQIEGDTSMITLNLSFLFSVFFFVPPPFFNRHNGKGSHNPSRQKSHGPACSDHRESEKQAQWPRRRHIQVQLLSPGEWLWSMLFVAANTWGQHFTKKLLHDYRLHSQLRLWVFIWVACLATWLPACPTGWSVVLSSHAHHIAAHCQLTDHPHVRLPRVTVTTHRQDSKWATA